MHVAAFCCKCMQCIAMVLRSMSRSSILSMFSPCRDLVSRSQTLFSCRGIITFVPVRKTGSGYVRLIGIITPDIMFANSLVQRSKSRVGSLLIVGYSIDNRGRFVPSIIVPNPSHIGALFTSSSSSSSSAN